MPACLKRWSRPQHDVAITAVEQRRPSDRMQQMTGFPLIDVHQHVIPDFYRSALARVGILGSGENPWPQWSMARTLELMDENGIAGLMISIASPGVYFGDVEFTRGLTRACNEALARMVGERPTRFGAMGFVPLPDGAAAAREVDYALDVLKLDGINLLTHTGDRYLGHPGRSLCRARPPPRRRVRSPGAADAAGRLSRWLYRTGVRHHARHRQFAVHRDAGEVSQYPLHHVAHGRRYSVPAVSAERLDDEPKLRARFPDGVAAYLRRLHYDVAPSAAPLSFRALLEIADPSRILFGTDYPFARNAEKVLKDSIEALARFDGFDDTLRRKIAFGNARTLFPRFANPETDHRSNDP
jgi:6-methylsalicylate decarboxylase